MTTPNEELQARPLGQQPRESECTAEAARYFHDEGWNAAIAALARQEEGREAVAWRVPTPYGVGYNFASEAVMKDMSDWLNPAPPSAGEGVDPRELRRLQDTEETWLAVCDALSEVAPGWLLELGTARELACNTIRRLATLTPQSGEAHPDALPDGTLSKSTMKRLATLPEPTPTVMLNMLREMREEFGRNPNRFTIEQAALDFAIAKASAPASPQGVSDAQEIAADLRADAVALRHHGASASPKLLDSYADRVAALDAAGAAPEGFYLASFKHRRDGVVTWWGPNDTGYTPDLATAGIYRDPIPGYHDSEDTVPVPAALIDRLRVRRVIDPGDSLNGAFNSRKALREWIAAAQQPGAQHGQEGR